MTAPSDRELVGAQRAAVLDAFGDQAESFNNSAVARLPETLDNLVALAAPEPGERWLDACCGPGIVARALAPSAREVVGIDATPAMVDLAAREARVAGLENVRFEVGDATALSLDDGALDGAVCRFALHHVPLPGRVVEELARVVRPGGRIVLCDHLADADGSERAWAQEIERLRDPSHWAALTQEELRGLAARAGLAVESEHVADIRLDFENWLTRGGHADEVRALVARALRERPGHAPSFRVRDGELGLRVWTGRLRRA